jgi:hypothetical protein
VPANAILHTRISKSNELAMSGRHPGGRPPYGYGPGYVINPAEAKVVRRMARRVLEGASMLALANELTDAGIPTREGRPWHHSTVRAVLINPAVAGLRAHRREIAGPGQWTPVLDRETWEQLRAVIADPARKRRRPARTFLLSGFVFNAAGEKMNGSHDIYDRAIYTTRKPSKLSTLIAAEPLEELIVDAVLRIFDDATLTPADPHDPGGAGVITAIEAELAQLAELRGNGTITLAEWMAARQPMLERLEAARRAAAPPKRTTRKVADLVGRPGALRRAWPKLTFAEQREILELVIESIVIGPATRGRWTPIEDRVTVTWRASIAISSRGGPHP